MHILVLVCPAHPVCKYCCTLKRHLQNAWKTGSLAAVWMRSHFSVKALIIKLVKFVKLYDLSSMYSNTFHILRPSKAPGFCYAWLELVSHRVFIGRMLAITPEQRVSVRASSSQSSQPSWDVAGHARHGPNSLLILSLSLVLYIKIPGMKHQITVRTVAFAGLEHVCTVADWPLQVPGSIPQECRTD